MVISLIICKNEHRSDVISNLEFVTMFIIINAYIY